MSAAVKERGLSSVTHGVAVLGVWLAACGPSVAKLQVDPEVRIFSEDGSALAAAALDARGHVIPNAAVTWHSSAPQVATVDDRKAEHRPDGVLVYRVLGGESGVAWLTAKAGSATADVRVLVGIPKSVLVQPPVVHLTAVGQVQTLAASVRDERGEAIAGAPLWFRFLETDQRPGAPAVATVAAVDGGLAVTATAMGHASLMVLGGASGPDAGQDPPGTLRVMVAVDVVPPPPPPAPLVPAAPELTVVPNSGTLKVGQSLTLQARLGGAPAKGKLAFKSLAPKLLSVTGKGKVKARKRGKVDVQVTLGKATARASFVIR